MRNRHRWRPLYDHAGWERMSVRRACRREPASDHMVLHSELAVSHRASVTGPRHEGLPLESGTRKWSSRQTQAAGTVRLRCAYLSADESFRKSTDSMGSTSRAAGYQGLQVWVGISRRYSLLQVSLCGVLLMGHSRSTLSAQTASRFASHR